MTQTVDRAGWGKLHSHGQWHFVQGKWTLCGLPAARPELQLFPELTPTADRNAALRCKSCERSLQAFQKGSK